MRRVFIILGATACALAVGATGLLPGCGNAPPGTEGGQDQPVFGASQLGMALLNKQFDSAGRIAVACYDLNGNGQCDLATEDGNSDGVCDALDCQGPPGEAGQPIPGENGLSCWDLNGNGQQDADEDINGDGQWTALDCQGPAGPPGGSGSGGQGPQGPQGPQLFDLFINDFFITDYLDGPQPEGSYQHGYVYAIPTGLPAFNEWEDMTAFAAPVPKHYNEGNPVTLRLFIGGEFPPLGCVTLKLTVMRAISGLGVGPYGLPRWIRLDDPADGFIVVDLPLNVDAPEGLALPDNLEPGQMLAFVLEAVDLGAVFDDNPPLMASILLAGAEFFEAESDSDVSIIGATVFYAEDFSEVPDTFCDPCTIDTDMDEIVDCEDPCPFSSKPEPGQCGCGVPEMDYDNDGVANCIDQCDEDPGKLEPGVCGCGVPDTDADQDGLLDCNDLCPQDPSPTCSQPS